MQPLSSRTGAWRTHHHRVATTPEGTACCRTNGLSGLDIARTLQYCCVSYVRAHIASSDFPRLKSCLKFRLCPVSEVRATSQRAPTRTSETKGGTGKYLMPAPLFDLKFPLRTCSKRCRNFKSSALAGKRTQFLMRFLDANRWPLRWKMLRIIK